MASPIGSSRMVTSRFGVRGLMSIFRRSSSEQQQGKQETEVKTKPVCKIGHLIDIYGLVTASLPHKTMRFRQPVAVLLRPRH